MLRASVGAILMALFVVCLARADDIKDAKNRKKGVKATITDVDAKKGTITVKMKDKEGKEVEKTFQLTEDITYLDSTGKAAKIDVFQSGDQILVIETEGKLKSLQKARVKPER